MEITKPKVLVIGAGPLGLMSLRYINNAADVVAFDCQDQIGGMWTYTENTEINNPHLKSDIYYQFHGCLRSSMYRDLVLNTPRQIMSLKDFPMNNCSSNFPTREEYLEYLVSYATIFDLHRYIQLNTFVQSVRLVSGLTIAEREEWGITEHRKFAVKCCNSYNKNEMSYHEADYVIVASGRHCDPVIPKIDGEDEFEGEVYHFHNFRHFDALDFKNKIILIVGFGPSSLDFIVQMMFNSQLPRDYFGTIYFAGQVEQLQSSNDLKSLLESGKLILKNGFIKQLGKNKQVTFADGSTATVDMIWYTTGYHYTFPFLENSPDKLIDWSTSEFNGNFWGPLYRRVFSIREPRLMFIGTLDNSCVASYILEMQTIVVAKYIKGEIKLPDNEEMMKKWKEDIQEVSESRHLGKFYSNNFGVTERLYISQYRELAKCKGSDDFDKAIDQMMSFATKCFPIGDFVTYRSFDIQQFFPEELQNSSSFM